MDHTARAILHLVACAVLTLGGAGLPPKGMSAQTSPAGSTVTTAVISPVVQATWFATSQGGTDHLDLLVLWRGTPGWFIQAGGGSSGGHSGGRGATRIGWLSRGTLLLTAELDPINRIAIIQGRRLELADHNVVLVDEVDSATGPRVTRTLKVARLMPGSVGQIGLVMRESPEIVSFLRCDAQRSDGRGANLLKRLCPENVGVIK